MLGLQKARPEGGQPGLRQHADPLAQSSHQGLLLCMGSGLEGHSPAQTPALGAPVPAPKPEGRGPQALGDIAASCVPTRQRPAALPEHKEVALLVAVAAQRLTDHVVVGVWVIPGLRRQTSQSGVCGGVSPRDLPHTCVPVAGLPPGLLGLHFTHWLRSSRSFPTATRWLSLTSWMRAMS